MDAIVESSVVIDKEQQMTIKLENQNIGIAVVVTLIYTKCTQNEKLILWETLRDMAGSIQEPWLVGGDFNFISNDEENMEVYVLQ